MFILYTKIVLVLSKTENSTTFFFFFAFLDPVNRRPVQVGVILYLLLIIVIVFVFSVVNMQQFLFNQLSGYVKYPLVSLDGNSIALPLDDVKPVKTKKGNNDDVNISQFRARRDHITRTGTVVSLCAKIIV